jgi:hypothetical protein
MEDYEISTTAAVAALKALRPSFDDRVVSHRREGWFTEVRYECGCRDYREYLDATHTGSEFFHCSKHCGSP